MITYCFTLYHDEPEEAAADSTASPLPGFAKPEQAVTAAQAAISDHWQSATVERGTFRRGELGVRPDEWDIDSDWQPILVTRDDVDDPRTYAEEDDR